MIVKMISANRTVLLQICLLAGLVLLIFAPVYSVMVTHGDFPNHLSFAEQMENQSAILLPHFLYQLLVIASHKFLFPADMNMAGLISVLLLQSSLAITIFLLLKHEGMSNGFLLVVSTISLVMIEPIPLLFPVDHHLYFGYIGLNVFHNPTMITLKPFALLLSYLSVGVICKHGNMAKLNPIYLILTCFALTTLSLLAKPSYMLCALPSILLLCSFKSINAQQPDWRIILTGIILPAMAILSWQYFFSFSQHQATAPIAETSKIIFFPFKVMSHYSPYLPVKLILSVAFPLSLLFCHFKQIINDDLTMFSWLAFLFGTLYTYLLAESGPRMYHGNFLWSGQISLFILFVASFIFFMKQASSNDNRRSNFRPGTKLFFCATIFALHILSGIYFYAHEYTNPIRYW